MTEPEKKQENEAGKNKNPDILDPRDSWNVWREPDEEKKETEPKEIVPDGKLASRGRDPWSRVSAWLENFWYHHKWKTIIGAFFAVVLIVSLVQMRENQKVDTQVLYAGPEALSVSQIQNIELAFSSLLREDANRDGERRADLYALFILSNEQIAERKQKAEDEGTVFYINTQVLAADKKSFDNEILGGDSAVCLLDPWLFSYVEEAGGFAELGEALGEMPEGVILETGEDGRTECYGIRLGDTAFWQYFAGVCDLPPDTVLCLRRVSTFRSWLGGEKEAQQRYEVGLELLRALCEFEAE